MDQQCCVVFASGRSGKAGIVSRTYFVPSRRLASVADRFGTRQGCKEERRNE
jgi:hypothetical protein